MILTPCRDAASDELPRTAATLLKAAQAAGWTARATYAKAEVMDRGRRRETFTYGDSVIRGESTGRVIDVHRDKVHLGILEDGRRDVDTWLVAETRHAGSNEDRGTVVESVAVRLRRWPLAAVGVWEGGKFKVAYVWSVVTSPRRAGARELSKFVKGAS